MAKNKKDLFKNNLSAPSKKPSDKRIEEVTTEISEEAEEEKGFHIKFPISDYNKLNAVSKKTHIPKKYIIINALKAYYEQNGY